MEIQHVGLYANLGFPGRAKRGWGQKFVRECQIEIIEHFSLETEEDGHTLLRPQTTDLAALRKYMRAYSSLYGDGLIRFVQKLMPDRFKDLVLQLFQEWIPFPDFE